MEPISRESELLVHQYVDVQLVSHCKEQIEQHGSPDDLKTHSKDREVFTAHGGRIDQELGVNRWLKIVRTGTCKISGLGPTAPWPFYLENLLSQLTAGCTVELACWVSPWSLQSDRLIYICR